MFKALLSGSRRVTHWQDRYLHLAAKLLEVRNLECLKKAMEWSEDPILDGSYLYDFQYIEDLNERRLRDAEIIGGACCNFSPKILLEIGTAHGQTTALMAKNAPDGIVYTVNIPPDEIADGGEKVTFAPSLEDIGRYYREQGATNVQQILSNTAHWEPAFEPIDVALVDGCHDADFVYNDTRKILKKCRPGSLVMWHDFNPELSRVYHWIASVCQGVDRLYADGLLNGPILHLQDSWVGLYRVPPS